MDHSQEILKLAKQNNGIITTAMIVEAKIPRGSLKYLADKGCIERTARGVYALPDAWEDEFINLQNRYKSGVFALETALFLCDLTDRTPLEYRMFFPATYNLTSPKNAGIICSNAKEPFYSMGVQELTTPGGNMVKAYSAEKTLCDILRSRNHIDMQIISDAYKQYVTRKDKNIPLLSEYANVLRVEKRLRAYLEVLL